MRRSRLIPVLLLGLALAASPAVAPAAVGPAKKQPPRGPRGPRGPKGPTGAKGPTGDRGPSGTDGTAGAPGVAGSSLVARMRGGGVSTGNSGTYVPVPLSNGTWTQPAGSFEWIVGSVTVTAPATCSGGGSFSPSLQLDGIFSPPVAILVTPLPLGATTTQLVVFLAGGAISWTYPLAGPDAATQHTFTMAATDSCTAANENYRIDAVKLNVYGTA